MISLFIPAYFLAKSSYIISVLLLVLTFSYLVIYTLFKKPILLANKRIREQEAVYFSELNNRITLLPFIKSNSVYSFFDLRFRKVFIDIYKKSINLQTIDYIFFSLDKIALMIAQIVLFIYGGNQVIQGKLTIGNFTVISSYFTLIITSVRYFFNYGKEYQEVEVSRRRVENILSSDTEIFGNKDCKYIESIKIHELDFSYNKDTKLLNRFTFEFKSNNIYIIKGNNGTGKSTLLKIIATLFYSDNENIFLNNEQLNKYDLENLRKTSIGILEQTPVFIDGSLEENLFLEEIDYSLLEQLIDVLNLKEFMENIDNNIKSHILERYRKLSGGEKQKISLLRLLIKKPRVILLDEPTSSLDDDTRVNLVEYLTSIKKDRIIIIVTHDELFYDIGDVVINL